MGATKKQKKKTGSAGGRHGQAGAPDAIVAAYGRLVNALGASGLAGTAPEAARTMRSAESVMAKPSGAACFFEVICCQSAHAFDTDKAHSSLGHQLHHITRLTAAAAKSAGLPAEHPTAAMCCIDLQGSGQRHGRLQAKVELLQAVEQLITLPHLASAHAGSDPEAGLVHQHLLRALRCAQEGAEQHNSLLCVRLLTASSCKL